MPSSVPSSPFLSRSFLLLPTSCLQSTLLAAGIALLQQCARAARGDLICSCVRIVLIATCALPLSPFDVPHHAAPFIGQICVCVYVIAIRGCLLQHLCISCRCRQDVRRPSSSSAFQGGCENHSRTRSLGRGWVGRVLRSTDVARGVGWGLSNRRE